MTVYYDTAAPGSAGPLAASGQVFYFGRESKFYLSVASNLISGQATGQAVQFTIYSHKNGTQPIQVAYGTTNTTYAVEYSGYMILAVVPAGASVSCRVVVSSDPFPLTVTTVSATIGGTVTVTGEVENIPLGSVATPVALYGSSPITPHASAGSTGTTSASISLAVTTGDIILVFVETAPAITTLSDGVNTYTQNTAALISGSLHGYFYTATAATTATLTITASVTGGALTYLAGASYTGCAIDNIGTYVLQSAFTFNVTATAVQAGDALVAWAGGSNSLSFSIPTLVSPNSVFAVGQQLGVGAGSQSVAVTQTGSASAMLGQLITLKATAAPVAVESTPSGDLQVQQTWNAGRTQFHAYVDRIAGLTTEALVTMNLVVAFAAATTGSTYTVPAGKTLRLLAISVSIEDSTTTAVFGKVRVRALNGTVLATSPIIIFVDIPMSAIATAAAGAGNNVTVPIPDGVEIPAGYEIGITDLCSSTSSTLSVSLIGFLY